MKLNVRIMNLREEKVFNTANQTESTEIVCEFSARSSDLADHKIAMASKINLLDKAFNLLEVDTKDSSHGVDIDSKAASK